MPPRKIPAPTLGFGDLGREEINQVLIQAGSSLRPPTRTPFATGIRRRPKKSALEASNTTTNQTTQANGVHQEPSSTHTDPELFSESTITPSLEPTSTPAQRPSSWASLLKSAGGATLQPQKSALGSISAKDSTTISKFTRIADIINNFEPSYDDAPLLEPRGLINNVNTCFMNVILQPLLHCPPFYILVKNIGAHVVHSFKSKTPLLDSMIEFTNEFRSVSQKADEYGEPFVPEYVYDALRGQKRFDSLRGRQEDAEEFLCFLLDGLHEEMIGVLKEQYNKAESEAQTPPIEGQDGWLEVGPKNKTSCLRTLDLDESPISKVFGGKVRSVLRCPGAKDSINMEPYKSLPLDIQHDNVKTIEDAIHGMTLAEEMHDYMSNGKRVTASKQVYLESTPPVLVLHIKRFVFDNVGGTQKLQKPVYYGATLTIRPEWMPPASTGDSKPITYRLFGAVYHHGAHAGGGHYTCDIKRRNGEWLHVDDTTITPVSEQDVLVSEHNTRTSEQLHADQTAYILFYMRT